MLALDIKNLHKIYTNGTYAVSGINLSVQNGDFFALLGPNGAGKTTIISIVSSIVVKTRGTIKVLGYDLVQNLIAAKSCMGVVPQEFNFNQFEKVIDIVLNQDGFYGIPRKLALIRAEKYLNQLGLWEKRKLISRNLSGGFKRRLMIARALIHEPKILILDEPTAGIDIELRRSTWSFLKNLNNQGTTIILTTHYLEEAEYLCKGIAIINKAKIVESTNVKKLIAQLPRENLIMDLQSPINTETLPVLENINFRILDNYTLEVNVPKSHTINDLFVELSKRNIKVISMRNKANRLEELFLSKIGNQ